MSAYITGASRYTLAALIMLLIAMAYKEAMLSRYLKAYLILGRGGVLAYLFWNASIAHLGLPSS